MAFVAHKEAVKEQAQRRNSELKPRAEGSRSSAVEAVEAAFSAWVADECARVLGRELSEEEEALHAPFVREARGKELGEWRPFKGSKPLRAGDVGRSAVDTLWVPTWKMVYSVKTGKARPVAQGSRIPTCRMALRMPQDA